VLSPGLPNAQEAIRVEPEIQNLFVFLALISTATIIVGGLISDVVRRRWLLLAGLAFMLAASLVAAISQREAVFYAANFVAVAASGLVLAYAIGSVALAYEGIPRATALGFVYGAFGLGAAASPALLTLFPELLPSTDPAVPSTFTFETTPAYLVTAVASAAAIVAAARWVPPLPGTLPAQRTLVVSVAIWSIAVLAIVTGVLGVFGPADDLFPIAMAVAGALVLLTLLFRWRRTVVDWGRLRLDQRGLSAALAVGVAVGFAQAIPLMLLPIVFEYPFEYGTLFAIVAIAPFAVALLLAGPIAGVLIRRFGPRGIMTIGTLALGLANLAVAAALLWIIGSVEEAFIVDPTGQTGGLPAWHYLLFLVPLALVGAGFVLATTVRTAIVFASTPRGLPGSAAAINEASVGLGSRIGIVVATTLLTRWALDSASRMVEGREDAEALVAEFELALISLGTPRFQEVYRASLEGAAELKQAAYSVAYLDGVVVALVASGIVGILGAGIAWLLMGRRDPINVVFDMQDEREREDYVPSVE
jgi:MFS family permease